MTHPYPQEREIVCPECQAKNRLVVDYLPQNAVIYCSSCGEPIVEWSDARDAAPSAIVVGTARSTD